MQLKGLERSVSLQRARLRYAHLVADAAAEAIVAVLAPDHVLAAAAENHVVATFAVQPVVSLAAPNDVVVSAAENPVIAATARKPVISREPSDGVIAAPPVNPVVVLVRAGKHVPAVGSEFESTHGFPLFLFCNALMEMEF